MPLKFGSVTATTKQCSCCGEEKEFSFFYKNKGGKYSLRATCIQCELYKRNNVYKLDKSKQKKARDKYIQKNYELCLERSREWRRKNLQYDAYRAKLYRTRKQRQCPSWANLEKIKEFYLTCPTGYHVDHVIPLKGTHACGLHVETNLQHLPAKENLKKRNLYGWET